MRFMLKLAVFTVITEKELDRGQGCVDLFNMLIRVFELMSNM